jgi:molybdopterin converting factor small subunit
MARVTVLYFSTLRQLLGLEREPMDLPGSATADELLALIAARHSDAAASFEGARLAVDQSFAAGPVTLRDGAELAVITPVSGG